MVAVFVLSLLIQLTSAQDLQRLDGPKPEPIRGGVQDFPCKQAIPEDQEIKLDFGGNCRYEVANAALPAPTNQRVVYFGDSITQGWGNRIVGLNSADLINRGVGGQTTPRMLVRYRADVLNLKPRVVHLLLGTNDIAGNTGPTSLTRIKEAIMSMAEQASAHGIRVVLASILPAKIYPWNPSVNPVPSILALNQWMKEYAANNGHVYADYYSSLTDGHDAFLKHLASDGIHPNAAGYDVMAPIALDAIQRANR
jgi:lysophospholipase L1-like esterase